MLVIKELLQELQEASTLSSEDSADSASAVSSGLPVPLATLRPTAASASEKDPQKTSSSSRDEAAAGGKTEGIILLVVAALHRSGLFSDLPFVLDSELRKSAIRLLTDSGLSDTDGADDGVASELEEGNLRVRTAENLLMVSRRNSDSDGGIGRAVTTGALIGAERGQKELELKALREAFIDAFLQYAVKLRSYLAQLENR